MMATGQVHLAAWAHIVTLCEESVVGFALKTLVLHQGFLLASVAGLRMRGLCMEVAALTRYVK